MGVAEGERKSQGEAEYNNHPFSSIGRQSSIYSLTLDEFQHTLCDSGKNFGSMNMDEFLSSIWNAEENQATNNSNMPLSESSAEIRKQPSLARQGSLTLPAPLCRKTVEEVWSEIHKGRQNQHSDDNNNGSARGDARNTECAPRQPTFGEMTLEDFLVKAGVVRESCANTITPVAQPLTPHHHHQQQYGMGPTFVGNVVAPYRAMPPGGGAVGEPSSGYAGNGKRDNGYPPAALCYGGKVVNGGGGNGAAPAMSPVSPDGLGTNDKCRGQFAVEMRGRKRMMDGPVEKVVERRQRRMIKNRESAARSRARKQAYTVELEAELNQLRDVNAHLKQALAEFERRKKQQNFEELSLRVHNKAQKAREKLRALRRNLSCPL